MRGVLHYSSLIIFLVLVFVFFSCQTTKVIYAAKKMEPFTSIGICPLNKKSIALDSIFPKLNSTFETASVKYAKRFLAPEISIVPINMSCQQPDSLKITEICRVNNLDALLLSQVNFRKVINLNYGLPIDNYFECVFYTKIVDKTGRLVFSVVHDSKDDTYESIPDTYDVVGQSIGISYKKINERMKP